MDKPFTILPDAPAMPGAKASPFYVQKEKTCYTRTSPNFNFLVFFEFLIEFLVGFPA